jgi:hypothetical protein
MPKAEPARADFGSRGTPIMGGRSLLINDNERYCARVRLDSGTLMRHFVSVAATPGTLPCRVPVRSTLASLIAFARPT